MDEHAFNPDFKEDLKCFSAPSYFKESGLPISKRKEQPKEAYFFAKNFADFLTIYRRAGGIVRAHSLQSMREISPEEQKRVEEYISKNHSETDCQRFKKQGYYLIFERSPLEIEEHQMGFRGNSPALNILAKHGYDHRKIQIYEIITQRNNAGKTSQLDVLMFANVLPTALRKFYSHLQKTSQFHESPLESLKNTQQVFQLPKSIRNKLVCELNDDASYQGNILPAIKKGITIEPGQGNEKYASIAHSKRIEVKKELLTSSIDEVVKEIERSIGSPK